MPSYYDEKAKCSVSEMDEEKFTPNAMGTVRRSSGRSSRPDQGGRRFEVGCWRSRAPRSDRRQWQAGEGSGSVILGTEVCGKAGPNLVILLCPVALTPGVGGFHFKPLTLAVAFAMIASFILSWTFVPALCSKMLRGHGHGDHNPGGHPVARTSPEFSPVPMESSAPRANALRHSAAWAIASKDATEPVRFGRHDLPQ